VTSISVALCVYNGAKFLGDQLASLSAQSRLPAEVIIGDDASEDISKSIIYDFSRSAPFQVRLLDNERRLGVRKNFERVISECSGDLIALCDQDDVWLPQKLEVLASLIQSDPNLIAAFSDAHVVDDKLQSLGYTMWEHIAFSRRRQEQLAGPRPWEVLFKHPVVTGATLLFRRTLVEACLPIPEAWVHDAWIAQLAAVHGAITATPEPLVLYRQHTDNLIGGKRISLHDQEREGRRIGRAALIKRESARFEQLLDRLSSLQDTRRVLAVRQLAVAKLRHLERRRTLPANRVQRIPTVVLEVLTGNYRRFTLDWRYPAADLFMP
jgi:hypothetical protein